MPRRDLIAIIGINVFARKNTYQTRAMADFGYRYDVLSTQREVHDVGTDINATVIPLRAGFFRRLWQVLVYLLKHRRRLHHAEVYVGGRFACVYVALARLVGVPVLIAERGDLFMLANRTYGFTTRMSMRFAYGMADAVWYRELYAEKMLRRMGVRRLYLLANAVPVPECRPSAPRDVDMLWVNRFKAPRRPEFAADALACVLARRTARAEILGLTEGGDLETRAMQTQFTQRIADVPGVRIHTFADPSGWFMRSRYFLLPADVTFANFALLEAMAAGVVPIISDVPGTELLVEDGVSGIVVEHSAAGFQSGIERALLLNEATWTRLSKQAHRTIKEGFGVDAWCRSLASIYETLDETT